MHLRSSFLIGSCLFSLAVQVASALVSGPALALPPLPGPNTTATASTSAAAPAPAATGIDALKRGVVTLENNGRVLGVGTVLGGDGRILTALSVLGGADAVEIHYADNSTVKGKVGHRDKAWDLALVIPQSGKWLEGLAASEVDPMTVELRAFVPPRAGRVLQPIVQVKGRLDAKSKDGDALPGALDVEVKAGATAPAGAPITDPNGAVAGMLGHACKAGDGGACVPLTIGVPVSVIRSFLVKTPANAVQPAPWLGIVGAPDSASNVRGVRVLQVAPQSPAEKGGLKANPDRAKGDLIMAVDGQPVDSPEKLGEAIGKHSIGDTVKLMVLGGDGKFREASVQLRAAP